MTRWKQREHMEHSEVEVENLAAGIWLDVAVGTDSKNSRYCVARY